MTLLPFERSTAANSRRTLEAGAWLEFEPDFLTPDEADGLLSKVLQHVHFEQRTIQIFGRRVLQPRLIGWAGTLPYRYSGQTLEPRELAPELSALFERVQNRANVRFNHILFNRYRDGQDAMGMHSDDEPELGKNPLLASLSLGATRRLVFARRNGRTRSSAKVDLDLTHGSLLIMGGAIQHSYRHGVPRQRSVTEERLNLTFRHLLELPSP